MIITTILQDDHSQLQITFQMIDVTLRIRLDTQPPHNPSDRVVLHARTGHFAYEM
jgi:hypothetical protein